MLFSSLGLINTLNSTQVAYLVRSVCRTIKSYYYLFKFWRIINYLIFLLIFYFYSKNKTQYYFLTNFNGANKLTAKTIV